MSTWPGVLCRPRPAADPAQRWHRQGPRHRGRHAAPAGGGPPTPGPPSSATARRPGIARRVGATAPPPRACSSSRQPCCAGTVTWLPSAGPTRTADQAGPPSRREQPQSSYGWRRRIRGGASDGSTTPTGISPSSACRCRLHARARGWRKRTADWRTPVEVVNCQHRMKQGQETADNAGDVRRQGALRP